MSEWYYSKDGAQLGPVSEPEIKALLADGTLDAQSSLVWKSGMADWVPAAQVPELTGPPAPAAAGDPYAAPASGFAPGGATLETTGPLPEIAPGSESIDPMACFKRAYDLVVRNLGLVLLAIIVWFFVSMGASMVLSMIQGVAQVAFDEGGEVFFIAVTLVGSLLDQIISIFLMLGLTRFMLNIASGREAAVGQLFGESRLILRGLVATLLFFLMVGAGLLLLIVPGIYLMARYGLYMTAIVDRDCGIIESFEESSRLTTNNRMNMVMVALISFAVAMLGCLALVVGLFFAYPVIELAWVIAYLWLRYGFRAAMDHPGTTTPMLMPVR